MKRLSKPALVPPKDVPEFRRLRQALDGWDPRLLPGASSATAKDALAAQIVESQRRIRYVKGLLGRQLDAAALDGASTSFDPIKGSILKERAGDHDEACWLALLSTHFGRNRRTGWQLAGDFYGRLGDGATWDWSSTSSDVLAMRRWLDDKGAALRAAGGRFGNHRKYESLGAWSAAGTGQVLTTYVAWVGDVSHRQRFEALTSSSATPQERFRSLFRAMKPVARFGRTATFDYLTLLGTLGLADIEPDSAYLVNATGPLIGARLLFEGNRRSSTRAGDLEDCMATLQSSLGVSFNVLEDAVCNWQKSPNAFVPFRG